MNESEIIEAIEKGKNVYWKNTGYKVILCGQYSLYTVFKYNDSIRALMTLEYKECFVGV